MTERGLCRRLQPYGSSIFSEISALSARHNAVNLGQGFPDFDGPEEVRNAAAAAVIDGPNQYAPLAGLPSLRHAITAWYQRWYGVAIDPDHEVTVTSGCTGAIGDAMLGVLEPGDEVLLIEPWYDSYPASVVMAGGVCRYAKPASPGYVIDRDVLEAGVTSKTRMLVVNSPHNPTGRVYRESEWDVIEAFCVEHDLVLFSDEVYETLVFDGVHRSALARPELRSRSIVASSVGKTFSLTGWKIGWTVAAPPLTEAIRGAHQFTSFCVSTPLQVGAVVALELPDSYFEEFLRGYRSRRDQLVSGLRSIGLDPIVPQGTYFTLVDLAPLGVDDDRAFCERLIRDLGVAAIPTSAFHEDRRSGPIRFAFCKQPEVLDQAIERLSRIGELLP
ncbi:MAG: aminotransferase class I/II-fold pyridoxal phosphate-dependent enzyme [Planctomycetota bacterium]|jgi:N-succinyldiaminopimelate aminotransferase|nr:aminotransferase class I/II-fold pyridoxal phosphate-dependent enzyme [Planctomycetota bacterium]